MVPKFRCDGCNGELKDLIELGAIYVLDNNLNGLSVMVHNNLKNKIFFCEECFQEFEDKLKEEGDWMSLESMKEMEDFVDFKDIKDYIKENE